MLTNKWLSIVEPMIEEEEGFRQRPYLDLTGRPTIGFGTTKYPDGRRVTMDDPAISREQGEFFLGASVTRVAAQLKPLIKVPLTAEQTAALVSLAYNVGVGARDGIKNDLADSTLLYKLNHGDMKGAADEFLRWNKAYVKGKVVAIDGLTKRRQRERAMFLGNAQATSEEEITRNLNKQQITNGKSKTGS